MTACNFAATLEQYVVATQLASNASYACCYPTLRAPTFTAEHGRRYVRIVRQDSHSSRSVAHFVDSTNGDILKADSWKAPVPPQRGGVRGNIFCANIACASRDAANDR